MRKKRFKFLGIKLAPEDQPAQRMLSLLASTLNTTMSRAFSSIMQKTFGDLVLSLFGNRKDYSECLQKLLEYDNEWFKAKNTLILGKVVNSSGFKKFPDDTEIDPKQMMQMMNILLLRQISRDAQRVLDK